MNNLKIFQITSKNLPNDIILELQNCSKLEELKLYRTYYSGSNYPNVDNKLGIVFKNNQKLKVLKLQNFYVTGECI